MRPGISRVGTVTDDGTTIRVTGWALTYCAHTCRCHHGPDGLLHIHQGDDGTLGLIRYRPCDCCRPWTADELAAVVRDLAAIGAMETA